MIGAPVMATVTFNYGSPLLSDASYTIVGGAIATQSWTPTAGNYTRTNGVDHPKSPATSSESWTWRWDETTGNRNVTVKATDGDGNVFTYPFGPFNVIAPTPSNYVVTAAPAQLGSVGGKWGLFSSSNGVKGVTYSARITMPACFGSGAFVQLVNNNITTSGYVSGGGQYTEPFTQTDAFPSDVRALDAPNTGPVLLGNYSVWLNNGAATQVGVNQYPFGWQPSDAPGQDWPTPDGTKAFTTSVTLTQTFKTYLDFQPNGGIHVQIGEIDWSITATATYKGPAYPMTQAQYQDPNNWTVTAPPPSINGPSYGPQLITWDTNVGDANGKYQTITYGQ